MKPFRLFALTALTLLLAQHLSAQGRDASCENCPCLKEKAEIKKRDGLYDEAIRLYQAYSMCATFDEQIAASTEIDRLQNLLVKQRDDARRYAREANEARKNETALRTLAEEKSIEDRKQRKNALRKARIGHNTAVAQATRTRDASLAISIAARSAQANRTDENAQELLSDIASDTTLYFYRSIPLLGLPARPKIALSPDGSRLAVAGRDSIVRFYDPYTGLIADSSARLPGYILQFQFAEKADTLLVFGTQWAVVMDFEGRIRSRVVSSDRGSRIAIAPDGSQWAHGDFEGRVYWRYSDSLGTLRHALTARSNRRINSLAFSPKGELLAVCTPDSAMYYDTTGVCHGQPQPPGVAIGTDTCVFNAAGDALLLVGRDNTLRIWNIPAKQVTLLPGPEKSAVEQVAYLNADSIFVDLKTEGPTLRSPSCLPHREFLRRADETQQGWLAGQGDHRVIVILSQARGGVAASNRIRVYNRDASYRTNFQIPDIFGKPVAVNFDPARGLIFIFRDADQLTTVVFTNRRYRVLFSKLSARTNTAAVPFVGYLPGSNTLVGVLPQLDQAILLDNSGGQDSLTYPQDTDIRPVCQVALDPQGILSYHTNNKLTLWRTDGGYVGRFEDPENPIRNALFSSNRRQVLTVHQDRSLKIWQWGSHKLEVIDKDSADLRCFDLSTDERWCAVGFADGRIKLFDKGRERRGRPSVMVLPDRATPKKIVFFPKSDSLLVLTSAGEVLLWNCRDTRKPQNRWRGSYNPKDQEWGAWEDLALSPLGQHLLLWGQDLLPKLYNLADTTEIELQGQLEPVSVAAFSPDGRFVLTGSNGSACRLWDLHGNGLAVWRGHERGVLSAVFSPDGKYAATLDGKGVVRAWDLPETLLAEKVEHFLLDDLAARGFIPEPEEALMLGRADALRESAFNFLRLGDDSTAYFLLNRLLQQSPRESADVWYAWYIAGGQTTADWNSLLALEQNAQLAIAERFKSTRAYGKAHQLYLKMLEAPYADLVRDIVRGYLDICPLARKQIDTSLPVFSNENNPQVLVEYANIFQDNGQDGFARILYDRAVQQASTPSALVGLLSIDADDPVIRQRILNAGRTLPDDEKLELVYELISEQHFDLAYLLCLELTRTPLYPQANMTLYEISLLSKGKYPFDTKTFLQSDSEALRYYVDYLDAEEGPDLRDTLQLKLLDVVLGNAYDYIDLYQAGILPFSDLLEVDQPDQLREFALYFSSLALQTDDHCAKVRYYQQATAVGDSLLHKSNREDDRRQVARYYNSLGWRLLLCGKFDTAGIAIRRGLATDSSYLYLYTNLPHAILFQGNFEEARALYLNHAGRDFSQFDPDLKSLRDAYLDDFNTFRAEAKERPGFLSAQQLGNMDRIERELSQQYQFEQRKQKNR